MPKQCHAMVSAVLALAVACTSSTGAGASKQRPSTTRIQAITIDGQRIGPNDRAVLQGWTIGLGPRSHAEFNDEGMTLRGLVCAKAGDVAIHCQLSMKMKRFESRARNCSLDAEQGEATNDWPLSIDCPSEIVFAPTER